MRIAVTGASGLLGHAICADLRAAGHEVLPLTSRDWDLATPPPPLDGTDALVHAAFAHVPGKYRGGEGDDPEGFIRRNRDGTLRLWDEAARAGVARAAFLSSRAVYGVCTPGAQLVETQQPHPDTLYGEVKLAGEQALAAAPLAGASLRITGVYGPPPPGRPHKWAPLFADVRAGRPIAPRVATEVHSADMAAAVRLLLEGGVSGIFNVSDIILDRRDLLAAHAALTGVKHPLPARADASALNVMDTTRLTDLGWRPRGMAALHATLPALL